MIWRKLYRVQTAGLNRKIKVICFVTSNSMMKQASSCVIKSTPRVTSYLKTNPSYSIKSSNISRTSISSSLISSSFSKRHFSDDSGFHDDFKSIRKQYQGETKKDDGDVMDFIKKGTPEQPQCGFSHKVIAYLKTEGVKDIKGINVLADPVLREAIKKYSDWPTIPQLYINNEFIGGENVTREMFESGELLTKLKAANIKLEPVDD